MPTARLPVAALLAAAACAAPPPGEPSTGRAARALADDDPDARARCATRLSIALLGQAPSPALLAADDPQAEVGAMLATPAFAERFARFTNARFQDDPGSRTTDDSPFYLARYVLEHDLPWSELFLGAYTVDLTDPPNQYTIDVLPDAAGLGIFRAPYWLRRYAGNEPAGLKLVTANRMLRNVLGVELTPVSNAPGADVSAEGREAATCRGCHYEGPFALDPIASILTRTVYNANNVPRFIEPIASSAVVLDGAIVHDDGELIAAMVDSTAYRFNACRTAFAYLYGRAEGTCDGPAFDACVAAFAADDAAARDGRIQDAIAANATDADFCE
jgi:hypothetical protein